MKQIQTHVKALVACGIVLAMVSSVTAQSPKQGSGTVVRIKGAARYSAGNNVWQPLKVGTALKAGALIQTAADSYVDIVLSEGEAAGAVSAVGVQSGFSGVAYRPAAAEQNVVRIWEDSVLGIDKLTTMQTGADVVSETQLDLRAGRIFGSVKKLSAASKYEVKIPNGVAGIRGTIYMISADGVVSVLEGSVVLAYVGADGTVATQVVMAGQQFDPRTGQVTTVSASMMDEMSQAAAEGRTTLKTEPYRFTVDHTVYFVAPTQVVSPTQGQGGGDGGFSLNFGP